MKEEESEQERKRQSNFKTNEVARNIECTTSVLCRCISSSHSLLSSCSVSAAVKMDASQRREKPCSVPIAPHCRKLIITLPSKITPTLVCPTPTVHPSLNLPPASAQDPAPASMTDRPS